MGEISGLSGTGGWSGPLVEAVARLRGLLDDAERAARWQRQLEGQREALDELEGLILDGEPFIQRETFPPGGEPGVDPYRQAISPHAAPSPGAPESPSETDRVDGAGGDGGGAPDSGGVIRLREALRRGELSARDVVERALAASEPGTPGAALNALIARFPERALQEAAEADRRLARGEQAPLLGVPVVVKDLMEIDGYGTTGGSASVVAERRGERAGRAEATAVARLRQAGAVVVGAANLHELAYGITSENPHYGWVGNPRLPGRSAGGSSGGSAAAVAAGLAAAGLGTDTGGSIRIPAAACGVVGLKPTYGRVPRTGVLPLGFTLDHVGPLTPRVVDAAALLEVLAGPDGLDPTCTGPALDGLVAAIEGDRGRRLPRWRVGWLAGALVEPVEPEVAEGVARAAALLEEEGLEVRRLEVPELARVPMAQFFTLASEALTANYRRLRRFPEKMGEDVRFRLEMGRFLLASDYLRAQQLRRRILDAVLNAFARCDLLLLPTLPLTPPPAGTRQVRVAGQESTLQAAFTRLTGPFNLTGLPALSLPVPGAGAWPAAVQLVAPPWQEERILRVGARLEERVTASSTAAGGER